MNQDVVFNSKVRLSLTYIFFLLFCSLDNVFILLRCVVLNFAVLKHTFHTHLTNDDIKI